jgi:predicted RNA-binding protein with PUA-like domain
MWLLKTEPGEYSYEDLVALRNLRQMKEGDRVLVCHTGGEKSQWDAIAKRGDM